MKEEEVERIDRPPSPRITRSRNKNLNWTDEDIATAKEGFGKHGKDFAAISRLFSNKSEHQVKNFYHNYKKKHNLDQLISDSKKKKPNEGSRRTRTNVQPLEAASSVAEDETQPVAEARPKSAEPQLSTSDNADGSKKRKKDAESEKEKKDDSAKSDDGKKTEFSGTGKSDGTEPVVSRAPTPSNTGPYRTRRTAAAANGTGDARTDGTKRSSDRSPVEEPAEKKIKKSKNATKDEKSEKEDKSIDMNQKNDAKGTEEKEGTDEGLKKEVTPSEAQTLEQAPSSSVAPVVSEIKTIVSVTAPVVPMSSAPPPVTKAPSVVTVPVTTSTLVSATPSPAMTEIAKPQVVPTTTEDTGATVPQLSQTKRLNENDGDSSATCSADEEPNLQDVTTDTSKADQRKHVDSPYAFDDESSTSIKLEPPKSTSVAPVVAHVAPSTRQEPTKATETSTADRPSSTHQPPSAVLKPQLVEKRPQSLPPPPGALAGPVSAVGPVRFQVSHPPPSDSRPSSTPMFGHLGGHYPIGTLPGPLLPSSSLTSLPGVAPFAACPPVRVPDKIFMSHDGKPLSMVGHIPTNSELRHALQISSGSLGVTAAPGLVRSTMAPIRLEKPQPEQIDLTKSQDPTKKDTPIKQAPARPSHHPAAIIAPPVQKDVAPQKMESEPSKVIAKGRKEQTPAYPVFPVSSLLFGRTSPPSSEAVLSRDHGVPGRKVEPPVMHPGPSHLSIAHPPVITSSVQTKFVSGSMTLGNPVLQKQQGKLPPDEGLKLSISDSRGSQYTQPPVLLDSTPKHPLMSRASIVKGTPIPGESATHRRTPGLDDVIRNKSPSPSVKGYPGPQAPKPVQGSIMTGQPVRHMENKPEKRNPPTFRTDFILGREVRVQTPVADPIRSHESKMHYEHPSHPQLPYQPSRFPLAPPPIHVPGAPNKPDIVGLVGLRGPVPPGSILTGAPVKRKKSDESNSSLSPSATQVPYSPASSSRPSPSIKQQERKAPHAAIQEPMWLSHLASLPAKKEELSEIFQSSRRTPDKLVREPTPRCMASSPGHRSTPTGILSQHPTIKQELPGSPRSVDDPTRRSGLLDHPRSMPATLTAPEYLRMQMALTYPLQALQGVTPSNPEAMNILRQYGGAHNLFPHGGIYPFAAAGLLPGTYPSSLLRGIAPTGASMSPRSPQTAGDEGMEATKKMLHQDFMTAQHMLQRNPVSGAAAILHGAAPHLVTGANAFSHTLGAGYHPAGLPVDRLNYPVGVQGRVRSPFSPQYQSPSGRSSITRSPIPISPGESSRSPVHRPPKAISPEIVKHRDRTSDPKELGIHPTLKEQNSATSPLSYHSPRGSTSPRECYTPQGSQNPHQLSPSQRGPVTTKPYYMYPSSSTPPVNTPYHPMTASPRTIPPPSGPDILSEAIKPSRSSPFLSHSRSGSLDAGKQFRQERSRPDSAGPRSMPQSPNMSHGHEPKSHPSPKPMMQDRGKQYHTHGRDPSRGNPVKQEDFYKGQQSRHRNSPKPTPKAPGAGPSGHVDTRHQIGHVHGVPSGSSHRQSSRSPCPPPQHIIHGVPTYPNETPKMVGKPPQPKAKDLSGMTPVGEQERITSKNPGEDLKKSGKAKMTAANLIDAIININYHTDPQGFHQTSPHRVIQHHGKPGPSDKPPSVGGSPHHMGHISPQAKQDGELKTSTAPPSSRMSQMAYSYRGMMPGGMMGTPGSDLPSHQGGATHPSPTMQNRTLLEHSTDVINECYRKTTEPRSTSSPAAGKSESPHLPRTASGNLLTEPISPPESRTGPPRGEPVKKGVTQQQSPYQNQQPMFAPHLSPQRHPPSAPQAKLEKNPTGLPPGLPHTPPVDPMAIGNPTGNNSSLEDIIRKALMQNSASGVVPLTTEPRRSQDMPQDPFITHAVMSMGMQRPMKHVPSSPPLSALGKPQEQWKESPKQPQSQSGGYMSALFLRQLPANSSPGQGGQTSSDPDRQQPFYGGQATPRPRPTHHVTGPQSADASDSGDQQQRTPQAPTMLPQYEALSDSD